MGIENTIVRLQELRSDADLEYGKALDERDYGRAQFMSGLLDAYEQSLRVVYENHD